MTRWTQTPIQLTGKTPQEAIECIRTAWQENIDKNNLRLSIVNGGEDEDGEYTEAYYIFSYDDVESDLEFKTRTELVEQGAKKRRALYEQLKKEFEKN